MANGSCCPGPTIVSEEICGNFNIPCGGSSSTVYTNSLPGTSVTGTITINYQEGCSDSLNVLINNNPSFNVNRGNTASFTTTNILTVSILCSGDGSNCVGKYCLDIHYPV